MLRPLHFIKNQNIIWSVTVSPVPSSQIIYWHRLCSPGGKEIRMQEVYEEVYALFFNSCEDKKVPDWAEREVVHPCLSLPYRDSELGWSFRVVKRGTGLHIFTSSHFVFHFWKSSASTQISFILSLKVFLIPHNSRIQ